MEKRAVLSVIDDAGETVRTIEIGGDEWNRLGDHVRKQSAKCTDAPRERTEEHWSGRLEGFCPVQGFGKVENLFWYFRARGEHWSFDVYTEDCSDKLPPAEKMVWGAIGEVEGGTFAASWLPYSEAWKFIESAIETGRDCGWSMPE